jgi:serine/threonine kinase 16
LKKIRCPFGQESVAQALKEVEAYSLFAPHPNIIHAIDHCVVSDKSDPGAKTVYILLPYYRRGNLQDMINANLVNHTNFPERRLMMLFLGVCKALKAMHQYRVKDGPRTTEAERKARKVRREAARADAAAAEEVELSESRKRLTHTEGEEEDDLEAAPLMEGEVTMAQDGHAPGQTRAYAHRDIKPGNA